MVIILIGYVKVHVGWLSVIRWDIKGGFMLPESVKRSLIGKRYTRICVKYFDGLNERKGVE